MEFRWGILVVALTIILMGLMPSVQAAPRLAPAFEVGLLDGSTFRLADQRGTAVILLFWTPW